MEMIAAIVAAFAAGLFVGIWRASCTTGQSMMRVLRGGGTGEDR